MLDNRIDELERALGFLLEIDQVRGILGEMIVSLPVSHLSRFKMGLNR